MSPRLHPIQWRLWRPEQQSSDSRGLWSRYQEISHGRAGAASSRNGPSPSFCCCSPPPRWCRRSSFPARPWRDTLLIGDHVLVDKLVYRARPARFPDTCCRTATSRRGDIIVFRYPLDIKEDYVKRAIGVPGDHIRLVNKQLMLNGHPVNEPYAQAHRPATWIPTATTFPASPNSPAARQRAGHAGEPRGERRTGGAARAHLRHGRQSRRFRRQPLLGLRAAREHRGHAAD